MPRNQPPSIANSIQTKAIWTTTGRETIDNDIGHAGRNARHDFEALGSPEVRRSHDASGAERMLEVRTRPERVLEVR
jgi:hypothetical protein